MRTSKICHLAVVAVVASIGFSARGDAERTDLVPAEEIENTYRARKQGVQLFRAEKYQEAVPYLTFAAERGFKGAQMQLGQIYFRGLGGVEQDLVQGIGWLGVAASGNTNPRTKRVYETARKNIPKEHDETVRNIVETFIQNYDGRRTRVICDHARVGGHTKTVQCRFIDESSYPNINIRG